MRRRLVGLAVGFAATVLLTLVLVPLRGSVSVSTITLVFIIPSIGAEVVGGFRAGLATVAVSAAMLDYYFIPPYGTLSIGSGQNWLGLGVYLVVVGLVGVVVWRLKHARIQAQRGAANMRRIYELSEMLVQDQSTDALLVSIVQAVQSVFDIEAVALFVLEDGHPRIAAAVGTDLTSTEISQIDPGPGHAVSLSTAHGSSGELRTVSLAASGRPVGVLVLKGAHYSDDDREMLVTFANDAAIAMERATLREQARRTSLLEEVDRLRHGLMGAVSHDLRTPLATIKLASSTLAARASQLSEEATHELHGLIEIEADRLTRLLANLLDMTRIEAGVFEVHPVACDLRALIDDALGALGPSLRRDSVRLDTPADLPLVEVDPVLITQVLVNLLDNAKRHSPDDAVVTVMARRDATMVVVAVQDEGPGVAPQDRESVFNRFVQFDTGGRAGLGLTIAKTFVEAHGQRIWCEEAPGGGARFAFSLPAGREMEEAD